MNFFQKIRNLMGFRSHPVVLAGSMGNTSFFEKLLFFNDQGIFLLLFFGSMLLHMLLAMMFGMISEFLKPEPPPIRAKIGVRYAKLPVKSNAVINTKKNREREQQDFVARRTAVSLGALIDHTRSRRP